MENCKTCAGLGCLECENTILRKSNKHIKSKKDRTLLAKCLLRVRQFYQYKYITQSNRYIFIVDSGKLYSIVLYHNEYTFYLFNTKYDLTGYFDYTITSHSPNVSIEIPLRLAAPIELLLKEYANACKKHPVFPDCKFKQFAILSEEVHEYNKELQHDAFEMEVGSNTKTELAQIGAVVLRIFEGYKNG